MLLLRFCLRQQPALTFLLGCRGLHAKGADLLANSCAATSRRPRASKTANNSEQVMQFPRIAASPPVWGLYRGCASHFSVSLLLIFRSVFSLSILPLRETLFGFGPASADF
jgi:hypothetical protein